MIESIKKFLSRFVWLTTRLRFEMRNGNVDNLGVVMGSVITRRDINRMMAMVRAMARFAESERSVKIASTVSNIRLNDAIVDAIERGTLMAGQRGYFSVTDGGAQFVILMPDGGKVEFIFTDK